MSAKVTHTLSDLVLRLLRESTVTASRLSLPRNLPREEYLAANKALELLDCQWNRGAQCHTTYDPSIDLRALVSMAMEDGEITDQKKLYQAYYTPKVLAEAVAKRADVSGQYVLEPSAGGGALAQACLDAGAAHVLCVELNAGASKSLAGRFPLVVQETDFLSVPIAPHSVTRVVMNPPFSKGRDRSHVAHAMKFLAPGGKLVAIVMGTANANNACPKWTAAIGDEWGGGYDFAPVPPGSFAESGTLVETSILTVQA